MGEKEAASSTPGAPERWGVRDVETELGIWLHRLGNELGSFRALIESGGPDVQADPAVWAALSAVAESSAADAKRIGEVGTAWAKGLPVGPSATGREGRELASGSTSFGAPSSAVARHTHDLFGHLSNLASTVHLQRTQASAGGLSASEAFWTELSRRADSALAAAQRIREIVRLRPTPRPTPLTFPTMPVDCGSEQVLSELRTRYAALGYSEDVLRFEPSERLPLGIDPTVLIEVLSNLVDNALRAVAGKSTPQVTVRATRMRDAATFEVVDNGPGFSAGALQDWNSQTMPFATESQASEINAHGLGLSARILRVWDSDLVMVDTSSAGTTFRVRIPLVDATPTSSRQKEAEPDPSDRRAPVAANEERPRPTELLAHETVLVVDDDQDTQHLLRESLEAHFNCTVNAVGTLEAAMQAISTNHYDSAIIDLYLDQARGEPRGVEAAQRLRSRNPEAIILMFSHFADPSSLMRAFRAGVDDFIEKSGGLQEPLQSLKRLAVRRKAARDRAEEARRGLYNLVTFISHELRSPLITIQRQAEQLALGALGPMDAPQEQALESILFAARRGLRLVNAHIDLNRLEDGADRLIQQHCDLLEVVKEEIIGHMPIAQSKHISVDVEASQDLPASVQVDVNRIRAALNPLLDNAIRYSPEYGNVTVVLDMIGGYVRVAISDEGPGISESDLSDVFEALTAEELTLGQRMRGSGLGLDIARRLIELHHGTLRIENHGGSPGATVTFALPLAQTDHNE